MNQWEHFFYHLNKTQVFDHEFRLCINPSISSGKRPVGRWQLGQGRCVLFQQGGIRVVVGIAWKRLWQIAWIWIHYDTVDSLAKNHIFFKEVPLKPHELAKRLLNLRLPRPRPRCPAAPPCRSRSRSAGRWPFRLPAAAPDMPWHGTCCGEKLEIKIKLREKHVFWGRKFVGLIGRL